MLSLPRPIDVKSLEGFLGLTRYYRRFINCNGLIAKPLTNLLRKNTFECCQQANIAFEQLKKAMNSAPVLALLDFSK